MRSTISRCIVLMLFCLFDMRLAGAQGIPSADHIGVPSAAESVNTHALAVLQQSDTIYQAMQSFSTEFEDGVLDKHGCASFSSHGQFAFRRPDHLAFAIGSTDERISEPKRVIFDGEHAYTLLSRSPFPYIPIPDYYLAQPELLVRRAGSAALDRLYGFLLGKGLELDHPGLELKSLTSKPERFVDRTPVETIKGRWVSKEHDSKYWEIDTYTIGQRDHLLYQKSTQFSNSSVSLTRYFHPQANVTLPDGLFTLPPDAVLLPSAYITAIEEDTVTLDKGSLDGLAINDVLAVFRVSGELKTAVGQIFVAKIKAHTCLAPILYNSGGLRPGDLCIVQDHQDSYTHVKTKPNDNAWLWPRLKR